MNKKNKLPPSIKHYFGYHIRGSVGHYHIYAGKNIISDEYTTVEDAIEDLTDITIKHRNKHNKEI